MKHFLLIFLLSGFLGACTSDEGTLKKMAQQRAEQKFKEDIRAEAQEGVPQSEVLQQAYMDFMHGQSEIEVAAVKFQGENLATVSLTLTTYPVQLRRTLLNVAKGVGLDKTRRFNFADAVPLVAKQAGLKPQKDSQVYQTFRYQKQAGQWVEQP